MTYVMLDMNFADDIRRQLIHIARFKWPGAQIHVL